MAFTDLSRRQFALSQIPILSSRNRKPNVIVMITDDQGYGDLSLHGNPVLKTPHLDSIGREGVQFTQFHCSPVCSPTRASLMTGRWNYRTGVVDTYLGRSMMRTDEVTLPQCLAEAGYATGIFGKWHLGDNYPLRAMDRGFQEALTHRGGGLAQPSGPPGEGYFNPQLDFNGKTVSTKGYCTDIFFDAAIEFIQRQKDKPFFTYLALNAPHTPLQIEDRWLEPFRNQGLQDSTARVYAMVANIDHNTGRLLDTLRRMNLEKDTILIYLTDNGPQQARFNAGLRGLKGSVYQGGIRVPCFLRWPGRVAAGVKVDRIAAHIDLMPTILDACGVPLPAGRQIDGRSLLPFVQQGPAPGHGSDRRLFLQWHRGDAPEPFLNSAVRSQQWKLVDGKALYDLQADPGELKDVATQNKSVTAELSKAYEAWFADVGRAGFAPPRIHLGTTYENPVLLTRQDWRGPRAGWTNDSLGHYEVEVVRRGPYDIELRYPPTSAPASAVLSFRSIRLWQQTEPGTGRVIFRQVVLPPGPGKLEGSLELEGKTAGAHYIQVKLL